MIIEKKHHEYLFLQRGEISHETDMERWESAYAESLGAQYSSVAAAVEIARRRYREGPKVRPYFSALDVGSGLGGVHILISRDFTEDYKLTLLDGLNDPPIHRNSFTTFSNAAVAKDFLAKNGLVDVECCDSVPKDRTYDLVISFAAYGFHIHPGNYIDDLKKVMTNKTILIFDVRRSKREWLREFVEAFGTPKVLHTAKKYVRLAFHV